MKKKITLLDGAVGTSLWEKVEDKKPVWMYNIERPDAVAELCREYVEAGAEIILANTFGANGPAVHRSSDYSVQEVVSAGVRIAKEAAAGQAKVALSIGPLTQIIEPYGDLSVEEAEEIYEEQIAAGMSEQPDIILLQTFMDLNMMTIAVKVAKKYDVPMFCAMTFEKIGKTLFGNSVEDVIEELEPMGIDAIGMNCSLGPDLALPIIKEFAEKSKLPIFFKPNAGKPILSSDGTTETPYSADDFAREVAPALEYVDYIGGCCGCNPSYIKKIKELL